MFENLAGQAVKQLGHGCIAIDLQPASALPEKEQDDKVRERAVENISQAWEKIGFTHLRDELWRPTWRQRRQVPSQRRCPGRSSRTARQGRALVTHNRMCGIT